MDDLRLDAFIRQVKKELLEAEEKSRTTEALFELRQVEIDVSVAVKKTPKGGISFGVVTLGLDVDREHTHSVKLVFNVLEEANLTEARRESPRKPRKRAAGISRRSRPRFKRSK